MSRQVVPEANPPELSLGPAEEPPAEGAKQWGVKEKPPPVRCLIAMNKDLQNAYRDEVLEDFQLRVGRQVRPRFRLFEFIRKLIRKNPVRIRTIRAFDLRPSSIENQKFGPWAPPTSSLPTPDELSNRDAPRDAPSNASRDQVFPKGDTRR